MDMKQEFKIGDKVVIKGVVAEIDKEARYSIKVEIDVNGDGFVFTNDGKYYEDHKTQSLFHDTENQERVVQVRDKETDIWLNRVFIKELNGRYVCWSVAETIEDAKKETLTTSWNFMRELPIKENYIISQEKETTITNKIAKQLLEKNFNASNTIIITVSTDYSSNVGQFLRHTLTDNKEICDGFGIDVPYPDESWDTIYTTELECLMSLYKYRLNNKKILLVEAGVIRGSNYKFIIDYFKNTLNITEEIYTVALFENNDSIFKSDFVGEYYDNNTQDLTFWWEQENKHWV